MHLLGIFEIKEKFAAMTKKENLRRVIMRDNPNWVPCGMESEIFLVHPIIERPLRAGRDDWGVLWDYREEAEGGTYPGHEEPIISEIENWREVIRIPEVDDYDWSEIKESWNRNPINIAEINREKHWITGALDFGVFERMYLLLGMENLLIYTITNPEEVADLAMDIAKYNVRVIKKFFQVVKPDMIRYGDDWGVQDQLIMSPDSWRQLIKPAVQLIYDAIHEEGGIVFQHSCGKIEDIFSDLVEMGMDVFDPVQPCNNYKMLKEEYGDKVSFCGAIDSQHVLGRSNVTENEVRKEVRNCIEALAKNGGYIARPSHDIEYDKSVMEAMNDEIKKYGNYLKSEEK